MAWDELGDQGLTIVREVLKPDFADQLLKEVDRAKQRLETLQSSELYRANPVLRSAAHTGFLVALNHLFCAPEVFLNGALLDASRTYLGDDFYMFEYDVQIALSRGQQSQVAHADAYRSHPLRPTGLVWTIALTDTGPWNGMTEFARGSLAEHVRDPVGVAGAGQWWQPELKAGDVLVRDLSLIHRGTPNPSEEDRYLLAVVMVPRDYPFDPTLQQWLDAALWADLDHGRREMLRMHRLTDNAKERIFPNYPSRDQLFSPR